MAPRCPHEVHILVPTKLVFRDFESNGANYGRHYELRKASVDWNRCDRTVSSSWKSAFGIKSVCSSDSFT